MENKRVFDIVTYPVAIEICNDKLYRFGLKCGDEPWNYFVDMKIVNWGEQNHLGEEISKTQVDNNSQQRIDKAIEELDKYINRCTNDGGNDYDVCLMALNCMKKAKSILRGEDNVTRKN